jgi:hypothetical protein
MQQTQLDATQKILSVSVSPKFTAIIDCLLGVERRTEPALMNIRILPDGGFLGQRYGHIGFNDFLGSTTDLKRNMRGIADVAGLTDKEEAWFFDRLRFFT